MTKQQQQQKNISQFFFLQINNHLETLTDPRSEDTAEDVHQAVVLHLHEGEEVEVTQQTWRRWVATSARGAHRTHKVHIHQFSELT